MNDLHALPDLTPETLGVHPLEQAETIPSSWYTDSRFLDLERDAVFARTWQYVGHASQLSGPGTYRLASVAGNPLILVRADDGGAEGGTVRAFYNVCRHRGGPLAMEEHGCATMLQCKYHGWTYRLDGSLRGVPRFDRTELFDKRDYGLIPVALAEWDGLLFVNVAADVTARDGAAGDVPTLAEVLDGIAERIAPMRLAGMVFARRVSYEVACNWKVYVDNYLEGYHIPLVHPELCKVLDYRAYTTETHGYHSLQHSPVRGCDNAYGVPGGDAFYYFVFPNTMLNLLPGRLQVNRVVPVSHARCRVDFDYYYDDVASEAAGRRIEDDLAFSDTVQAEDAGICEHVQRGLGSRGYDRGRFSVECERGVYHFQGLLKAAFREALALRYNGEATRPAGAAA